MLNSINLIILPYLHTVSGSVPIMQYGHRHAFWDVCSKFYICLLRTMLVCTGSPQPAFHLPPCSPTLSLMPYPYFTSCFAHFAHTVHKMGLLDYPLPGQYLIQFFFKKMIHLIATFSWKLPRPSNCSSSRTGLSNLAMFSRHFLFSRYGPLPFFIAEF